jgi:hypothetical protein
MSHTPSISAQKNLIGLNFERMMLDGMSMEIAQLLDPSGELAGALNKVNEKFAEVAQKLGSHSTACQCAPISQPSFIDSSHPQGSLQTRGNSVTTAGGYKIEMIGQHEWKITGPDGKSTRIWGDPHVDENDGGKWDFKRNSTFVLGDGTRINVTTVPFGNGATVTGSLEIISGNDRVMVSDIDKGKGKIGTVTQDGYQRANSFRGDVFVQGRETDDWSLTGKEIVGSNNQGESFKLGGDINAVAGRLDRYGDGLNWARSLFDGLMKQWSDVWKSSELGANAYSGNDRPVWEESKGYDRPRHVKKLRQDLRAMGEMFNLMSRFVKLNDQLARSRSGSRMNA